MFDFNAHFKKFHSNIFFEEFLYSDLLKDISRFTNLFNDSKIYALKFKSPYLTIVGMIACFIEKKTSVLLSPLENDSRIEEKRIQFQFEHILEDHHFNHQVDHLPQLNFQAINQDDISFIIFSSGSSSAPKAVALTFNNIYYSSLGFSEFFNQGQKDCSLINLPHHHVGGLMTLWRAFFTGGMLTINEKNKIDFLSLVPIQLKRILSDPKKVSSLKSCRVILIGGAPLTQSLKDEALKNELNIYETYGMTETSSLVTANGIVLPYRDVALDKENHFIVKGKTLSPGYFKNNIFIPTPIDGFKTSDRGENDSEGRFLFKERTDLIFISGGENINPLSVEDIVKQIPEIKDACLLPIADELWGEIGVLLYELNTPHCLCENDLKLEFKKRLHPHHIPKFFFETTLQHQEQLKIKRNELKILAQELYLKKIFSYDLLKNENCPTIVFFHGFLGDKSDLKIITDELKNNYSLLFIDLPGHGETKIKNFHSTKDIFSKLSSFIKLFDSHPIYYGYSMGGRIALQLALNYLTPKILILESAGPGLTNASELNIRLNNDIKLFNDLEQKDISTFIDNWYSQPMFKPFKNHPTFKINCEIKCKHDLLEWRDSQNYLSQGSFSLMEENLKQLPTISSSPIIYIYGELDLKYKSYAQILSPFNAKIIEIKGAGHNPHLTHPHEITNHLNIYLK